MGKVKFRLMILLSHLNRNFFWSKSDYEKHWLKASEELSLGKDASSITSITNPENSNFIRTWTCCVKNRELIFHENILF